MTRHSSASSWIYGRHAIAEMIRAKPNDIEEIIVSAQARDIEAIASEMRIRWRRIARDEMTRLVGTEKHQGVAARVKPFTYTPFSELITRKRNEAALLLALDHVQDPGNVGSMVRSCVALGAHGMIIPERRSCTVNETVIKRSAGCTALLPIACVTNLNAALEQCKKAGYWIIGLALEDGSVPIRTWDFSLPTVIVVGAEGDGMRASTREYCDQLLHIPMTHGVGSLNASIATGVALYEAFTQRSK